MREIRKLKNHKVAGANGLTAELLKYGGERIQEAMFKVLQKCWSDEEIPDDWGEGIYVPLHKKDNRLDCKN